MTLTAPMPAIDRLAGDPSLESPDEVIPIGDVRWRQRTRVRGKVRALRVQPWDGGVATLECTLVDETGGLVVIFMGRRRIGGVNLGVTMEVEGMVIENRGRLAIMNPAYTLLPHD
jgi:DNA/RNA endonuclease YhcR with UshA esterase domain